MRQQIKRNRNRFPDDFMLQLTDSEVDVLLSQNVIPSRKNLGGHLPYAFTEQGVAMLSSVLNSERAIYVNIQIMRAFIKLREMLTSNEQLRLKIEEMEKKYDHQFQIVFDTIKHLLQEEEKPKRRIGFHTELESKGSIQFS